MCKKSNICGFLGIDLKFLEYKNKKKYSLLIEKLLNKTLELYCDSNYNIKAFIIDCEIGSSMIFGEIIVNLLQNVSKEVYLYNILPFKNRETEWDIKYQERYRRLVKNCTITSYLNEKYTENCFEEKNKLIIKYSDIIFTVCDLYDKKINKILETIISQNKKLIILDIKTLKFIEIY